VFEFSFDKGKFLGGGHGGSSGGSTTVTVPAVIMEPAVVPFGPAQDSSLPNDVTLAGTVNYSGSNFTDREKFYARWAYGQVSHPAINCRLSLHVTIEGPAASGSTTTPTNIYVFTAMPKPNNEIDIHKVATNPTSTLPDSTRETQINSRIRGYNITISGFNSNEAKVVKMALDKLTDRELERMRDVRITRGGSGGERIGGHYQQASHTIEIFNTGMENGLLFCLGTDPAHLLPKGAHAVLHESAHVLAYWEIRRAGQRDQQARRDLDAARATMRNDWSQYYTETTDADGNFSYTAAPASQVQPPSDRPQYQSDLDTLESALTEADSANQAYADMEESQMMTRFTRDTRGQAAVTPYSRDEMAAATDDDTRRMAREEFMAEAFSIYRFEPSWLNANRRPVKRYFDQNHHLLP
jgi:hypothetical protein